jgi:cytochrome b561
VKAAGVLVSLMKKWIKNYILFIFLLLSGLLQAISGFLLWLVIPGGHRGFGGAFQGQVLWSRYTWIEIHDWTAVALVVLVILHIILHWKWIIYMTKKTLRIQSS